MIIQYLKECFKILLLGMSCFFLSNQGVLKHGYIWMELLFLHIFDDDDNTRDQPWEKISYFFLLHNDYKKIQNSHWKKI